MISEVHNIDCMEFMRGLPDKFFDLAVVDPPYGININFNMGRRKNQEKKHTEKKWDNAIPKFNNNGKMIFNCFDMVRDTKTPKIHPTQKSVPTLEQLIEIFTDKNDVVIDPVAGSGTTLIAAANKGRRGYGFEIKKNFYKDAVKLIDECKTLNKEIETIGYAKTELSKVNPVLF